MVSEKFLDIAKRELREEENRKQQALEHFREWIKKHPYIKSIRQGKVIEISWFQLLYKLALPTLTR